MVVHQDTCMWGLMQIVESLKTKIAQTTKKQRIKLLIFVVFHAIFWYCFIELQAFWIMLLLIPYFIILVPMLLIIYLLNKKLKNHKKKDI